MKVPDEIRGWLDDVQLAHAGIINTVEDEDWQKLECEYDNLIARASAVREKCEDLIEEKTGKRPTR